MLLCAEVSELSCLCTNVLVFFAVFWWLNMFQGCLCLRTRTYVGQEEGSLET